MVTERDPDPPCAPEIRKLDQLGLLVLFQQKHFFLPKNPTLAVTLSFEFEDFSLSRNRAFRSLTTSYGRSKYQIVCLQKWPAGVLSQAFI